MRISYFERVGVFGVYVRISEANMFRIGQIDIRHHRIHIGTIDSTRVRELSRLHRCYLVGQVQRREQRIVVFVKRSVRFVFHSLGCGASDYFFSQTQLTAPITMSITHRCIKGVYILCRVENITCGCIFFGQTIEIIIIIGVSV